MMSVRMTEEEHERFRSNSKSISGRARRILTAADEIEEEYDLRDDIEATELAVLRAYRNAIGKNIEAMKVQKEKVERQIEEIVDEDTEEILFEIDIDIEGMNV